MKRCLTCGAEMELQSDGYWVCSSCGQIEDFDEWDDWDDHDGGD